MGLASVVSSIIMPSFTSRLAMYVSPLDKVIIEYMNHAKRMFITTPPTIIISLCHAGLERYSQGCGSFFKDSVSIDSSTIPAILQYPPNGSHPMPYSVSPIFFLKSEKYGLKNM